MFQKYVAIVAAWVTVPLVGAACMPPAGADASVCMRARESGAGSGGPCGSGRASRFSRRRVIEEARELRPRAPSVRTSGC